MPNIKVVNLPDILEPARARAVDDATTIGELEAWKLLDQCFICHGRDGTRNILIVQVRSSVDTSETFRYGQGMTTFLTAIQRLIRHEAQRLTQDGHTFATAVEILTARGSL